MLRFLSITTLILIAVCLAVSASIALADTGTVSPAGYEERKVEAVDPDRRMVDDSLAATALHNISTQDL